jgi:hypothetical protein
MPDSILPLLTKNDRLDFVDYLDSNMKAEVTNKLGGKSEMTTISEDYAHIAMSESSEVALKILKRESDSIICIVHTHKSQASDSYLKFYTKDWTELPTNNFIRIPNAKDFLTINDTISPSERENIINKIDAAFIKAELQKESTSLTLTLTSPLYMSEENRKSTAPFIKETITLKWTGKRFE